MSERTAFVTLLMINDSYLPGCLMAAYGLRRQGVSADLACMVTPDITQRARDILATLYDAIVDVVEVNPPRTEKGVRQALPRMLTRFNALQLGSDGDLECHYGKIVLIDADLLPLRDFEALLELDAPAGVINERREHMVELDDDGAIVPPREGSRSVWHDVYGSVCPHSTPIPKEITDRVRDDPTNFGVNGSLYVLEPSQREFDEFMAFLDAPDLADLVQTEWPWPDMQAATLFWSGRWTSIDAGYSILYGYPDLETARGLHFAGVKPWSWRKKGFEYRLTRFADFRLWATRYREMLGEYPELRALKRLKLLDQQIARVPGFESRAR